MYHKVGGEIKAEYIKDYRRLITFICSFIGEKQLSVLHSCFGTLFSLCTKYEIILKMNSTRQFIQMPQISQRLGQIEHGFCYLTSASLIIRYFTVFMFGWWKRRKWATERYELWGIGAAHDSKNVPFDSCVDVTILALIYFRVIDVSVLLVSECTVMQFQWAAAKRHWIFAEIKCSFWTLHVSASLRHLASSCEHIDADPCWSRRHRAMSLSCGVLMKKKKLFVYFQVSRRFGECSWKLWKELLSMRDLSRTLTKR